MARIVVELTNRCNLRCQHCFTERHAATGDLSFEIIEKLLSEGKSCGIDHLAFTGGEPAIHHQFSEIIHRLVQAGYTFSFVSNGFNFPHLYPLLLLHRRWFTGVTFSLDGASEETHDRLRGKGSYRRVMQAASICVIKDLPFTFNMVLTAQNRHEVSEMVWLAERLGSRGVRFAHLMNTPETAAHGLDLSPSERREVEAEIWGLQKKGGQKLSRFATVDDNAGATNSTRPDDCATGSVSPSSALHESHFHKTNPEVPIGMAPGYFSESPFFPCGPLELEEFNLDYRGNLTLCCHLSGLSGVNNGTDVVGNLADVSLPELCDRFRQLVAKYLADKRERVDHGEFSELDHFPCLYCVKYLDKGSGTIGLEAKREERQER